MAHSLFFRHAARFLAWSALVHAGAAIVPVLAGSTVILYLVQRSRTGSHVAMRQILHGLTLLSLAGSAGAAWLAASPPALTVSPTALARVVARSLASVAGISAHRVRTPPWAHAVTSQLLHHYAGYVAGTFQPLVPRRYRMVLLLTLPQGVLVGLPTFGTTGLASLEDGVVGNVMRDVPESVIVAVSHARDIAVGLATGLETTAFRRGNAVFVAVYIKSARTPRGHA